MGAAPQCANIVRVTDMRYISGAAPRSMLFFHYSENAFTVAGLCPQLVKTG